jgi:hypothetical protein
LEQTILRGAAGAALAPAMLPAAAREQASRKPLRPGLIGAGLRGTCLSDLIVKLGKAGENVELVAVEPQ